MKRRRARRPTRVEGGARWGMAAALQRWLEHRAVAGYTESGMRCAAERVSHFIAWAAERDITHPAQVSRALLQDYQLWLLRYRKKNGLPLADLTRRDYIVMLRGWFKWLTQSGEIPANPAADLDVPRVVQRLPRWVLTAAQVERVLSGADVSTALGLRDRAAMEVLYATGVRRAEAVRLDLSDIDLKRELLLVRQGKWQRDRLLPLGERAAHWVQRYVQEARPRLAWNDDETALFLSDVGQAVEMQWLTKRVSAYVQRAQLGKGGGCHLLRHTMATLMLEGGADLRFVQAMLGHAQLSSTEIYTHVAIGTLQRVHALTHPGVLLTQSMSAANASMGQDMPTPAVDEQNATQAFLLALQAEAEDEIDSDE